MPDGCSSRSGSPRSKVLTAAVVTVQAQEPQPEHPPEHHRPAAAPEGGAWTWTTDANVIAGYNYQQRKFADFAAVESQNWLMAAAAHKAGAGRLTLSGMVSLEP